MCYFGSVFNSLSTELQAIFSFWNFITLYNQDSYYESFVDLYIYLLTFPSTHQIAPCPFNYSYTRACLYVKLSFDTLD